MQYVTVSMDASESFKHRVLSQQQSLVVNDPMLIIEQLEDEAINAFHTEASANESLAVFVRRFVAARLDD